MSTILFTNQSTPAVPTSGKLRFYVDSVDGILKSIDSLGSITTYAGVTVEYIQDIVGSFISANSSKVVVNYNDVGNVLTIDIDPTQIDHTQLQNIGTNSHADIDTHIADTNNPHGVTKAQVGLSNVDNTSDANKPISTATQTALDGKVDENSAIVGAQHTKITYDSKGLVTSGTDAELNDMSDVALTTPVLNDVLKFNGANWVNAALTTTTNASSGINYFFTGTASGISTYELMSKTPDVAAEIDESIVVNNNTLAFEQYISDVTLNDTLIDPGVWNFNIFSYVSANIGTTKLTIDVYKRTAGGTETLLFSVDSPDIDSTVVTPYSIETVQPAFTTNATDKLLFKISASTTSITNVTVHLVHSGTTHYSFVSTPLVVHHNDLSDLQGGTSNQYYHLTSPEYNGTGTGVFVRTDSPNIITPTGIVKNDVGLGNVDNTSDVNKPISNATQTALNAKEPTIAAGTTGQYWRGDKTWQTLNKAAVGLGNVDNTADTAKAIAGDVTGTLGASTVAKIQNRDINSVAPTNGQSLTWNSTTSKWEPQTVGGGSGVSSITTSASVLTLTAVSNTYQLFLGTVHGQSVVLPDATTLQAGSDYFLANKSDTIIPVFYNGGALACFLYPDQYLECLVLDVSTAAGKWVIETAIPNPMSQIALSDDFISSGTASGAIGQLGWTLVTGTAAMQASTGSTRGLIRISSTTTNNGTVAIHTGLNNFLTNGGVIVYEARVSFPSLGGNGAAGFTGRFGLGDTTNNNDQQDGIYFEYAGTAAGTINWSLKTATANTRTTTNSGVAVAAATFYKLSFVLNAAGNSVGFYINGNYIASITTNIPTATIGLLNHITTNATNAAAKSADIDYVYLTQNYNVVR